MTGMIRKLIVEVIEARDLLPKDGTGTSSPYVVIDFDGQRKRTKTIHRNLNPTFNEALEFKVNNSVNINTIGEPLEVEILHDRKAYPCRRSYFLGRIKIDSTRFVKKGEEALEYFPMEKKSFFSFVRGDVGLKIYYVDEPEPEPVVPEQPVDEQKEDIKPAEEQKEEIKPAEEVVAPVPEQSIEAETEAKQENETEKESNDVPETKDGTAEAEAQPQPPPTLSEPEKEINPMRVPQQQERPKTPEPVEKPTYDLVDKMHYLFIRVVRARALPMACRPHVRIEALGCHVSTQTARRGAFHEWDQTFCFSRVTSSPTESSNMELSVWDLPPNADITSADVSNSFLGGVFFDISEIPTRDPPDSNLALQWYKLEGGTHNKGRSDVMLAAWIGTQADASFDDAIKADDIKNSHISRSKIYMSPKLWYLRATVLEGNPSFINPTSIYIKATLGFQVQKTRGTNEDMIFVAAEPFSDESLTFTLESKHGKETFFIGSASIKLLDIERRVDDRKVTSRWLDLIGKTRIVSAGRLHIRACFDGGYHVSDEPHQFCSDFRPSGRQLWKQPIGALELGIIGCKNLLPMEMIDGKGCTNSYVVAKYGPKWARTRTVFDNFDPLWNEQYTWPLYDVCTVLTIAVFDESDQNILSYPLGKVRIRASTLEADRSYRCCYPLVVMMPSGAKKMGEIEIAIRISSAVSKFDLLHLYVQPTMPAMHAVHPISVAQTDHLRLAAARIIAGYLARSEPTLRKEVVMCILDAADPRGFSMRKVRANYYRIVNALYWVVDVTKWVSGTRKWRNPASTMIAHVVMVLLICFPELVIPTLALHVFGVGVWRYRYRTRVPEGSPNIRVSGADSADRDELEEEFDPIPSVRSMEVVRLRYDKARVIGVKVQVLLADVAGQVERVQALVSWRDPRATGIFLCVCVFVAAVLYVVPSKVVAVVAGFYWLRHPMFRDRMPSPVLNFFRRLPALSDRVI